MPNVLPEIPWTITGTFMLGLLGLLGVVGGLLFVWNQGKRAFGRTPPMHEELNARDKALRKMIFAAEKTQNEKRQDLAVALRNEFKVMHDDAERRITMLEEQHVDMQTDRLRKWDELQKSIQAIAENVAFMRGQKKAEKEA